MPDEASTGSLDPLFLVTFCVIFFFAISVDIVDMILEFAGAVPLNPASGHTIKTTIAKSLLTIMDLGTTFLIGGWTYWAQKTTISKGRRLSTRPTPQKGAKAAGGTAGKAAGKTGAKAGGRIGLKTGLKTGFSLIGELIPFVGAAPFWTLTVLETLYKVIRNT